MSHVCLVNDLDLGFPFSPLCPFQHVELWGSSGSTQRFWKPILELQSSVNVSGLAASFSTVLSVRKLVPLMQNKRLPHHFLELRLGLTSRCVRSSWVLLGGRPPRIAGTAPYKRQGSFCPALGKVAGSFGVFERTCCTGAAAGSCAGRN